MKSLLLVSSLLVNATLLMAQNTAVVTQQSGEPGSGNRAVISQSGSGNIATIRQGGASPAQSVSVTQSGGAVTHIDQTDANGNRLIIHQTGDPAPSPADTKPRKRSKPKPGRDGQ